jgi:hypothetical protein
MEIQRPYVILFCPGCGERVRHGQCCPFFVFCPGLWWVGPTCPVWSILCALSWAGVRRSGMVSVVHSLCSVLGWDERVQHVQCGPFFMLCPGLWWEGPAWSVLSILCALSWAMVRGSGMISVAHSLCSVLWWVSGMSSVVHSLCSVLGYGERVRHGQCSPFFVLCPGLGWEGPAWSVWPILWHSLTRSPSDGTGEFWVTICKFLKSLYVIFRGKLLAVLELNLNFFLIQVSISLNSNWYITI